MTPIVIGSMLAIIGTVFSILGALDNNLFHHHRRAMILWSISNPILFIWAIGFLIGWWDGGLSISFLAAMYLLYIFSNTYGMWKYKKKESS